MGRPHDTASLIKAGRTPRQIADEWGITLESVEQYVVRAIGDNVLRWSDVYFAYPLEYRQSNPHLSNSYSARLLGDMYEDVRMIEVNLHALVRGTLEEQHGTDELGWWRKGVPEPVRIKCQERRERDEEEPCEAYCYTDLLDLGKIIENDWPLFKDLFVAKYSTNRKALIKDLATLNRTRNKVMHPVRGNAPDEDDFVFVRGFFRDLNLPRGPG